MQYLLLRLKIHFGLLNFVFKNMSYFQWRKEKIFVSSLSNIVIQQLDLQGFLINLNTVYEAGDK